MQKNLYLYTMKTTTFKPEDEDQHFITERSVDDQKKLQSHFDKKHALKAKLKAKQKTVPSLLKKFFG
jgi:hypothetical protein